jgi:hypothetical protein
MPQLQKAIPLAAAPFKKFRRVVIGRLPQFVRIRFLRPVD